MSKLRTLSKKPAKIEVSDDEVSEGEEEHEEQADSDRKERRRGNPFARVNFDNPCEPEDQGAE
jgi:hypothetical protein